VTQDEQALAVGRAVLRAAESLRGPGQIVLHFRADRRVVTVSRREVERLAGTVTLVLDSADLAARQ
jgi:hypothetical protein